VEQAGLQTIATFNGTLLTRKRVHGKPFVQLIFREAGKDWLCLSSDIAHAARLQVGKKYRIEGIFKSLGEHTYIHEPQIAPLAQQIVKRRLWISLAIALAILLTGTGIVLAATHKVTPPSPGAPVFGRAPTDVPVTTPTDTPSDAPAAPSTNTPPVTTATSPPQSAPTTPPPATPPVLAVTPQPPADTIAPTVPTDLMAGASLTGGISLSWQASTDDVAVVSYEVFRDGSSVSSTTDTTYTDTTAPAGVDHTYTVVAFDAANNMSASSAPYTVPATPEP